MPTYHSNRLKYKLMIDANHAHMVKPLIFFSLYVTIEQIHKRVLTWWYLKIADCLQRFPCGSQMHIIIVYEITRM